MSALSCVRWMVVSAIVLSAVGLIVLMGLLAVEENYHTREVIHGQGVDAGLAGRPASTCPYRDTWLEGAMRREWARGYSKGLQLKRD